MHMYKINTLYSTFYVCIYVCVYSLQNRPSNYTSEDIPSAIIQLQDEVNVTSIQFLTEWFVICI